MSIKLESLENLSRPKKRRKLLGRGPGCRRGKTCGRGQKGMGARSGYKTRQGYIGGGARLHMRLPTRGFSNARFTCKFDIINLEQIEELYKDGETVSSETLHEKGYFKKPSKNGVKVLGKGNLTKKVKFEISSITEGAREKVKDHEINLVSR
ncbi:MAG: 50S ribosomal protein L15 [Chlamydiales bacterium]|nr:50S ribosomal protein L15 [Chlamydiales bacterium]MCH9635785.1 50S ribosomal protein L15 [Chlamydiales bacterium]MCH9703952.1 50S ribosomal protein L15 [Chlamydiota bacterium]